MTSDALSSIGISLEEVRREAGDAFDVRLPDERKIPYSARATNALVGTRLEENAGLPHSSDATEGGSSSDSRARFLQPPNAADVPAS